MVMLTIKIEGALEDVLNNALGKGLVETKTEFIRTAIIRYALNLKLFIESPSQKNDLVETNEVSKQGIAPNNAAHIFGSTTITTEIPISAFPELQDEPPQAEISEKCLEFLKSNPDRAWLTARIADKLGLNWRRIVSPLSHLARNKIIERKYDDRTPYYLFRTKRLNEMN